MVQQLEWLVKLAEVLADITGKIELEVQVKIQQLKEFRVFNSLRLSIVLLLAIYCWNSFKS